MIGTGMIRDGGAPQAIKRWVFGLIHSISRKTEQKHRTLRFRLGEKILLIDIRGREAFGLINGKCVSNARDASQVLRQLLGGCDRWSCET